MTLVLPLPQVDPGDVAMVGGKATALAALAAAGFRVPEGLCVTTTAYRRFLDETPAGERLAMELGRKDLAEMRWEEFWDLALRIRHLFLTQAFPPDLEEELAAALAEADWPAAVRSSAPHEDGRRASFAGMHESLVNVRGTGELLRGLRMVWASLWSDRALLYRRELGLAADASAMGVLVQKLVAGERSGILFSRAPGDPKFMAVEAVWGLNQGLVDGNVAPDRWLLDRQDGTPRERHAPEERTRMAVPGAAGVRYVSPPAGRARRSALDRPLAARLYRAALAAEKVAGGPRDLEWTVAEGRLHLLQARPITAVAEEDPRRWYLTLQQDSRTLEELRRELEETLLPAMAREADGLAGTDWSSLSDAEVAAEAGRRQALLEGWEEIYRRKCIPMAHGVRLFGRFYNDLMNPEDPFRFVDLLAGEELRAVRRNRLLAEGREEAAAADLEWLGFRLGEKDLARLRRRLARRPRSRRSPSRRRLEGRFLEQCRREGREEGPGLLDLARASYRLRDDDNVLLGRLRGRLAEAMGEASRRGVGRDETARVSTAAQGRPADAVRPRQLAGQPAAGGLARGPARVVRELEDLARFEEGEVLVCDAVEPNLTLVAPLAVAVAERRGGMLIHGAIIAREYGLPCVTGIPHLTELVETGDLLTVDGYLGVVVVEPRSRRRAR